MKDPLIEAQLRHHKNQLTVLEKQLESKKAQADKKLSKLQEELGREIRRIEQYIEGHKEKIKELTLVS